MRFQPVKCNIIQLTRKGIKKINAVYSLEGTVLENVDNIKYLGVTISKDLKWNTHVSNVCTKANRTLGFLRRNLSPCPQDVKEMAYKGLVRPILLYASPVWDSHGIVVQEKLENVQICVEVLRPSQPNGSCPARSVYLTTHLLGRLLLVSSWKAHPTEPLRPA